MNANRKTKQVDLHHGVLERIRHRPMDGDEALPPPTPPEEYADRYLESSTEAAGPTAATATSTASSFGKDDFSIFPPSLHEGLFPIKTLTLTLNLARDHQEQEEEEEKEEEEDREVGHGAHVRWRKVVDSGIDFVRSKISGGRRRGGVGAIWSFAAVAGLAGILIYMRRCHRQEKHALLLLILDKDKKIAQLMQQIAQMNEVISSRPRVSH